MTATPPPIELEDLRKAYVSTEIVTEVLRGLSLTIEAGEFVAIMGQSGSGKSTLMNLLGLLDRPTSGAYRLAGRDVGALSRDERAALRRGVFGFVFQQYNLIPTLSARGNVEVPGVYAGLSPLTRRARAEALLARLGLADRLGHLPSQLSGGQQQRVSIARALMNGGQVILADEPTGALDSASGAEVMALLAELAELGHTVILITHDREVARTARRTIEIRDGAIVLDSGAHGPSAPVGAARETQKPRAGASLLRDLREAARSGGRALMANSFRTALTLLGIVMGVAAVIALAAIGEGAKEKVLAEIAVYGANRMYVVPATQNARDARARMPATTAESVARVPNVAATMPWLEGRVTARAGNVDHQTNLIGATREFPRILNWRMERGAFFTAQDEAAHATVAVIGPKLAAKLFPDGAEPIGRSILVDNVPFEIIGLLTSKGSVSGDQDDDDRLVTPYSTASRRILGREDVTFISVLIAETSRMSETEAAINAMLEQDRGLRDFSVYNSAAAVAAAEKTQNTMTMLLAGAAAISLLVGGIGVMNVMLMTVTERTREIGVRMATGARTADILRQFLAEAMLVSGAGGLAGAGVGVAGGLAAATLFDMPVVFSVTAIVAAVLGAVGTGLLFGFMPALRASRLEPVAALARE